MYVCIYYQVLIKQFCSIGLVKGEGRGGEQSIVFEMGHITDVTQYDLMTLGTLASEGDF